MADLLQPDLLYDNNRGTPLSPIQQVCIALNHYGGNQFQRVSAVCAGVCQGTARNCLVRVTEALVKRRADFMFMPSMEEMAETSSLMEERFHLPRFAMAVDGMMVRFSEAPRGLPEGKHKQQFWCRKQFYALNCQVVANEKFILDVDCRWPGSTHDSRVWRQSDVKEYMERQRRYFVAGDSGYPKSEVLIKPYATAEAANCRRKTLFNRRISGLRTVMSENIYGVWKRRFPILKAMRTEMVLSQKIIIATAILFNISRMWRDDGPDDDDSDSDEEHDGDERQEPVRVEEHDLASVRVRGQVERERLKDNMTL